MSTQQNPQIDPQALPTENNTGRDSNGRFTKGNGGGPGNPFARQTAQLRQAMLDHVSPHDIAKIIQSMVVLAIAGNVPAAKLVLQYAVGKPTEAPNPDRLDQEEFDLYKEGSGMTAEATRMIHEPDAKLPVAVLRGMRWANLDKGKDVIMSGMKKLDEKEGVVRELGSPLYVPRKSEEAPKGNGDNGDGAPKPNGDNGGQQPINRLKETPIGNGENGGHRLHAPSTNGNLHAVK